MKSTRRSFLKGVGAGVLFLSLGHMGFSMKEAHAYARSLKIEGCKEYISVCPFCAVCCQIVAYVKNGKTYFHRGRPGLSHQRGIPVRQGRIPVQHVHAY